MRLRDDDTLQSSNTPTYANTGVGQGNTFLQRAIVIGVKYVDDPRNVTHSAQNPEVTYDVVLLGGFAMGQILTNVRLASFLGGDSNVYERTLRACSKPLANTRLSDQDGDVVYLEFISGSDGYPVIVGLARGIHDQSGTTALEGPRELKRFNGVEELVDREGQHSVTQRGGALDQNNQFQPAQGFVTKISMTKDETILLTTKSGVEITIAGSNQNITINASGASVIVDGSSGQITLDGGKIDLGSSASDFVVLFNKLKEAYDLHTHTTTSTGNPTSPPTVPLPADAGSQTVKVQP